MIELRRKTNEVDLTVKFSSSLGGGCKIDVLGKADLSHHLIEELFGVIDKLSRMESIGHQSAEWRNR